jgi:hypothetical protein
MPGKTSADREFVERYATLRGQRRRATIRENPSYDGGGTTDGNRRLRLVSDHEAHCVPEL